MMTHQTQDVEQYMRDLEPERREALQTLRTMIMQAVPGVKETMHYRMPTYKLDEVVLSIASQKHYMSLYMDTELVAKYQGDLGHLNCGKSCIRFKKIEELPLATIERMIRETVEKQSAG
jgi:uncharacterized protein YdhG (YjbR/CyaY superfamily)